MRVLHIVSGLQKASGVTTFVENVVDELRVLGYEADILAKQTSLSADDLLSLDCDIVHIHGLWDPWLHKIAKRIRKLHSRAPRLVWSPHGMLQKWALKNKWWKKVVALALYQWSDLRKADLIHVTAQSEEQDVRRLGLHNEIVMAPLGVRLPDLKARSRGDMCAKRTMLFVSRVQRKKGLPNLLNAWARLPGDIKAGWTIRIVGPDEDGHACELMRQCDNLGIAYEGRGAEVAFVGPRYGVDLDAEYESADLFVLPTHSENFGSVVIEALAHSVPVICTKEAPWEELETHKCGWWIEDNEDALFNALKEALLSTSVAKGCDTNMLVSMGKNGFNLVKDKYNWQVVGKTLANAYWAIAHGCEKGRCVDCSELYDTCSP